MKLFTVLSLLTFLYGCSSNLTIDENYIFGAKNNDGIVVLSTRTNDKCRGISNSSTINFSGKQKSDAFFLENSFLSNDFNNPPGYFQIKVLPPGRYTFTSLYKTGVMQGSLNLAQYKTSFTVKSGKIQYLGELHANIPDCNTAQLEVKDQRKRDRKIFDKRMSRLKSSEFEYQILKIGKK